MLAAQRLHSFCRSWINCLVSPALCFGKASWMLVQLYASAMVSLMWFVASLAHTLRTTAAHRKKATAAVHIERNERIGEGRQDLGTARRLRQEERHVSKQTAGTDALFRGVQHDAMQRLSTEQVSVRVRVR